MAKQKRIGIKIDMTPMVDVAFLLLIFFMSTTQFKPPEEVSVNLPASTSEYQVPMSGIIVLTVTKDGKIYIGDESGRVKAVPPEDLKNMIVEARKVRSKARIIVKGDKTANFGVVADVMDALQHTNSNIFNLMTELDRSEVKQAERAALAQQKGK